jgi:hypothetical protein
VFRLNLDDWSIYLSKQKRDRHQIDLLNDYICIINGGAFEIKLCFNELQENLVMVRTSAADRRVAPSLVSLLDGPIGRRAYRVQFDSHSIVFRLGQCIDRTDQVRGRQW